VWREPEIIDRNLDFGNLFWGILQLKRPKYTLVMAPKTIGFEGKQRLQFVYNYVVEQPSLFL
jgi:hypothetical protein